MVMVMVAITCADAMRLQLPLRLYQELRRMASETSSALAPVERQESGGEKRGNDKGSGRERRKEKESEGKEEEEALGTSKERPEGEYAGANKSGVLRVASSMRLGRGAAAHVRLVEKKAGLDRSPYALRASEVGPTLATQIGAFHRFLTSKFYGPPFANKNHTNKLEKRSTGSCVCEWTCLFLCRPTGSACGTRDGSHVRKECAPRAGMAAAPPRLFLSSSCHLSRQCHESQRGEREQKLRE